MQLGRIQSTLTAKCIFSCTFSCNWFCLGAFTYILGRYAAFKQSARVFRVSLLVFTVVCICILIGFVFVFDNNLSRWCWCVVGSWSILAGSRVCETPGATSVPSSQPQHLCSTFSRRISEIRKWEEKVVLFMSAPRPHPTMSTIFHSKSQTVI